MDGMEKIAQRILNDNQTELAAMQAEVEGKVQAIGEQAHMQADKVRQEILQRGQILAQERLERLESAARMETRKLGLEVKQEMIEQAFSLALERLCQMPEDEYIALLTRLVVEASVTGREEVVFSPKDRARVGKQVVMAANEQLQRQTPQERSGLLGDSKVGAFLERAVQTATAQRKEQLTLSEQTRPMLGGFIMVDGDIELNCTLETLVYLQREGLEKSVAQLLFV